MLSRQELLTAIKECEELPPTLSNSSKLATFYTIYDHLYGSSQSTAVSPTVNYYGSTEFAKVINGKDATKVMQVMEELADTLQVLAPKLYYGVIDKLRDI